MKPNSNFVINLIKFFSQPLIKRDGFFIFLLSFSLLSSVHCQEPTPQNKEKGKAANPSKFKVSYSLERNASAKPEKAPGGGKIFAAKGFSAEDSIADIAVNILDARFVPVRTFVLRGVKKKERVESLWDGRDVYGREMPAGNYYASLSIVYSDGAKESKFFKFEKE